MAASSSSLKPPPSRLRPPHRDVFRPRFPLDPFTPPHPKLKEPWFVKHDQLPSAALNPRRDVILVLGAPTALELSPLLLSKHLSNSLIIIASHEPPEIPHTTLPAVRLLRLAERLDIQDAGAVRFVNVLEWAERVARIWRRHGGVGSAELTENDDGQDYVPSPSLFRFMGSQSTPVSPHSSRLVISDPHSAPYDPAVRSSMAVVGGSGVASDAPPLSRPRSTSSTWILGNLHKRTRSSLPSVDPTQRPFDGIVNFLPRKTPDKALLKQAILVTTISRPFLMAANVGCGASSRPTSPLTPSSASAFRASLHPHEPNASSKRRSGLFFGTKSTTSVHLPPTPPYSISRESLHALLPPLPSHAHLLHLLPQESRAFNGSARSKLVESLESFLISYGYPPSLGVASGSASGASSGNAADMDRARPYLMHVSLLAAVVAPSPSPSSSSQHDNVNHPYQYANSTPCTLADLILYGSLDSTDGHAASSSKTGQQRQTLARVTPRVWIPGVEDVVLVPEDSPPSPVASISSASSSAGHQRSPSHDNHTNAGVVTPSVLLTPPLPDGFYRDGSVSSCSSCSGSSTRSSFSSSPPTKLLPPPPALLATMTRSPIPNNRDLAYPAPKKPTRSTSSPAYPPTAATAPGPNSRSPSSPLARNNSGSKKKPRRASTLHTMTAAAEYEEGDEEKVVLRRGDVKARGRTSVLVKGGMPLALLPTPPDSEESGGSTEASSSPHSIAATATPSVIASAGHGANTRNGNRACSPASGISSTGGDGHGHHPRIWRMFRRGKGGDDGSGGEGGEGGTGHGTERLSGDSVVMVVNEKLEEGRREHVLGRNEMVEDRGLERRRSRWKFWKSS